MSAAYICKFSLNHILDERSLQNLWGFVCMHLRQNEPEPIAAENIGFPE